MTTEYKIIYLYFKRGFSPAVIAMLLDLTEVEITTIIDQEWKTISNIQKIQFIENGEKALNHTEL